MNKKIVVALGGNAILQPKQKGTFTEQLRNVEITCEEIAKIVDAGNDVVITHGNGPQVGNILEQNLIASSKVPSMPLEVCGAMSQGMIGYMIQQSLYNVFLKNGINKKITTILTQVVVDKDDPSFKSPTKPIGAFVSEAEALKYIKEKNETWIEDSGRGWRKVVASPKPLDIVEIDTIVNLIDAGTIVIASGGGGIPVIFKEKKLVGIEAVIDKDLTASLLAKKISADMLLILTDVPKVAINYNSPNEKYLDTMTITEARNFLQEGQFGKGSMAPKVEAAINFAEAGGEAIITSLSEAYKAIEGKAGTKIIA